ncbi:MAG: hypothetical protein M0R70_04495 [Nitrospirae bacterium]|nr:hypothetical protein [Nitrospirota bacterium]
MKTVIAIVLGFLIVMTGGHCASAMTGDFGNEYTFDDDPSRVVNRPVNVQGLTGLVITNSAYTQRKGSIVAGLAVSAENSNVPDFSLTQGIATVTAGVTDRIEIGIRATLDSARLNTNAARKDGVGDTDILFKWRLSSQGDTMPAIALGLACTLPTGDEGKGFRTVKHEGIRLMLIGTSEKEMSGGYLIGVYFEGQIVFIDKLENSTSSPYVDQYGVFNAGVLVPLFESRRLQAIVEYHQVTRKDVQTLFEQNSWDVMPGLRYVTPDFNLSLGVQFLRKDQTDWENTERYVGTISYRF